MHTWSLGTAYASFLLLALALVLGPVKVIRGEANPVHSPLRRDVGVAAGLMAIVHTVIGLQVHFGGSLSRYFLPPPVMGDSDRLFLAANWMGLLSAIFLAVVVVISNNPSLRNLGLKSWKLLQRGAYPAALFAALHGLAFQLIEKRSRAGIAVVILLTAMVVVLQMKGRSIRRRSS